MTGRVLLASPLAFLIGVALGALGGGGSIVAVPVLVFVAGQTPVVATTTSLIVVGVASLIGAAGHFRSGRVRVVPALVFGTVGIPGSIAGSAVNRRLDPDMLLLAFSGVVLVAAWRMVVGCPSCTRTGERRVIEEDGHRGGGVGAEARVDLRAPSRAAKLVAAGSAVGFLTGLFGVGGGFVIVPSLALLLGFSMPQAVGTSLLVIAVNCVAALGARLGTGAVDWDTALLFTAVATAGVGVGKRIADRLRPEVLQRSFGALLVLIACYTAGRALLAIL